MLGAKLTVEQGVLGVLSTDASGNVVLDTPRDHLEEKRRFRELIAKHASDGTLQVMLRAYEAAVGDEANEFVHLYEIRDALKQRSGSEKQALKTASDTLRFVFERVLARCIAEGLVAGEGFAIDASLIKADANHQRGVPGGEANWSGARSISRPVREYLAALNDAEIEKSIPKNISLTDPGAHRSAATGPAFYAYSTNYLVDIDADIVVDVAATPRTSSTRSTRLRRRSTGSRSVLTSSPIA